MLHVAVVPCSHGEVLAAPHHCVWLVLVTNTAYSPWLVSGTELCVTISNQSFDPRLLLRLSRLKLKSVVNTSTQWWNWLFWLIKRLVWLIELADLADLADLATKSARTAGNAAEVGEDQP